MLSSTAELLQDEPYHGRARQGYFIARHQARTYRLKAAPYLSGLLLT
jgi:hypothetical protein